MKKLRMGGLFANQESREQEPKSEEFDFSQWKEGLDKELHSFWKIMIK